MLGVLPLQLHEGLAGTGEARTWLLPALRKHVCGAELSFWASQLLPQAKQLGAAAAAASSAGKKGAAVACHALEVQLWGSLQAFASWPSDATATYPREFTHVNCFFLCVCVGGGAIKGVRRGDESVCA